MCAPMIMAGVSAAMTIAGGVQQQRAAKAAAKQALQEGIYAQQAAAAETEQIRYNNKRDMGTLRAAFGTRNVAFDSASMVDVLSEAAGNMDLAAVMKEHEGILGRYQGNVTAKGLKDRGKDALTKSILGAGLSFATKGVDANWWNLGAGKTGTT
ncbi:MAG: hypothetical protein K8S25_01455 [Alphaproteobacteria bacterium]|nr:hypothetical protein [Alphaproteobacteria bacterium]